MRSPTKLHSHPFFTSLTYKMSDDDWDPRASPLADEALTNQVRLAALSLYRYPAVILVCLVFPKILDLVQQAVSYKQLKKGANEGNIMYKDVDDLFLKQFFFISDQDSEPWYL